VSLFLHILSGLTVVIEKEPAGGYFGLVPAIPGCGSQGDTIEETLTNVDDALMAALAVMREDDPERLQSLCGRPTSEVAEPFEGRGTSSVRWLSSLATD
jgi:predicted RNase H-like HicB family nuclease